MFIMGLEWVGKLVQNNNGKYGVKWQKMKEHKSWIC